MSGETKVVSTTTVASEEKKKQAIHPLLWMVKSVETGDVLTGLDGHHVEVKRLRPTKMGHLCIMENFFTAKMCEELLLVSEFYATSFEQSKDLAQRGVVDTSAVTSTRLEFGDHSGALFASARKLVEPFMIHVQRSQRNQQRESVCLFSSTMKVYTDKLSSKVGMRLHMDSSPSTVLVYLNTVEKGSGGYTTFPKMGIKVRPVQGRAIWFSSFLLAGRFGPVDEPNMLHGAEPLTKGRKVICQFLC